MLLPIGENSYSRVLYIIFLISMCLLPFSTGGGSGSNSVVVTFALPFLLLLSIFIIYNFISKKERTNYSDELKLAIFCGFLQVFAILISSLLNQNMFISFARSIFHIFGFTIFLYITSNSFIRKNAILVYNNISLILILSGCIMSTYFIINFLIAIQQNSLEQVLLERENGGLLALPWGASNTIAACLMMPLFVSVERLLFLISSIKKIGLIPTTKSPLTTKINFANYGEIDFTTQKKSVVMMIFAIIIILTAVVITQSRNVLLTVAVGALLIGILTKNFKRILIFSAILATLFFAVVILSNQDLESVFSARVGDGAQDVGGFNGRTLVWETSIAYFINHPLQPIGYFGLLQEIGFSGHNVFITTLIEQGIIGLIVYLLFLINNFSFCIKKMSTKYLTSTTRITMTIYLIAMFSMLIQLQFEDSNLTAQNIIYNWVFLALMYLNVYCDAQLPLMFRKNRNFS